MGDRVLAPGHVATELDQPVAQIDAALVAHHRIDGSVRAEDRDAAIGGAHLGRDRIAAHEVGGEREDARERLRMAQCDVHRERATLREAGEHDLARRDAALDLARDQGLDAQRVLADAALVVPVAQVDVLDVVPRGHHEAVVERDGDRRRVREDETHAQARREAELGHDRLEVVSVGAEAVQPDHGRVAGALGADLDAGEDRVGCAHGSRGGSRGGVSARALCSCLPLGVRSGHRSVRR